jgi:hypothetical protein
MAQDITPERVAAIAAAARVPLAAEDAARIAAAVAPTAARFAAAKVELSVETEPSTFVVVQRGNGGR